MGTTSRPSSSSTPTCSGSSSRRRDALLRGEEAGAKAIQVFDPLSLGVLAPPGELGADIAVAEGQSLGNHLAFGGPYLGLIAARMADVRRMPGRIVGETVDVDGAPGYVLTLQAREQHIRREKANSNICTNQTLMAVAATIYLGWLGPDGLAEIGRLCAAKAAYAAARLTEIDGCRSCIRRPRSSRSSRCGSRLAPTGSSPTSWSVDSWPVCRSRGKATTCCSSPSPSGGARSRSTGCAEAMAEVLA